MTTNMVIAYAIDLVYPRRVSVVNPGERTVIGLEDAYWNITARFRKSAGFAAQGLYNRLKSGQTVNVDLVNLALPTIPTAVAVTSSSLGDDHVELRVGTNHAVELDSYVMYAGSLMQVSYVGVDRVRVIPRPTTLPTQDSLNPAVSVECFMPGLGNPSSFQYPNWSEITLDLRTM